jgi:hypothetical protein
MVIEGDYATVQSRGGEPAVHSAFLVAWASDVVSDKGAAGYLGIRVTANDNSGSVHASIINEDAFLKDRLAALAASEAPAAHTCPIVEEGALEECRRAAFRKRATTFAKANSGIIKPISIESALLKPGRAIPDESATPCPG